jgi:hypothetical protein
MGPHLAGRHIHQVPVAQHSSVACQVTQHLSLFFSWKKNDPITPALVNPHDTFSFGLCCSCSLTSWGFWDPPNVTVMALHFTQDPKSSLVAEAHCTEIVTVVCLRGNVGSGVVAPWQVISLHFLKQQQFVHLEFKPLIHFIMDCWTRNSHVGSEVLTAVVMKSPIFWDVMLCSPFCFMLVSSLAYSWTLKMVATCSSKMLDDFQLTAWCYTAEDTTL